MASFKFSPIAKIPFTVENENGGIIREYVIDAGSESFFRAISEKGTAVVREAQGLGAGVSTYDSLLNAVKEYVEFSLGEGEFDFLYTAFDKNIFALVELCRAVSSVGQSAVEDRMKRNAAVYGD